MQPLQNPKPYPYQVPGVSPMIMQTDFDDRIDVIPVSDPNIFSMSQRIALSQTQLQLVQQSRTSRWSTGIVSGIS